MGRGRQMTEYRTRAVTYTRTVLLTEQEYEIYQALVQAAENFEVCPDHLDLNEVVGYESTSASSGVVTRLHKKHRLIVREVDNSRFRRVQIVATGKWTKPNPAMKVATGHTPRGVHDPKPLLKAMGDLEMSSEAMDEAIKDFPGLLRLEKRLDRAKELVVRRKNHFLVEPKEGCDAATS